MSKEDQNINSFFEKYHLIGSSNSLNSIKPKVRMCRFCKKDENNTEFKKTAHACPELLGRNNYIIYDECDRCNEIASRYESHLSKFFLPYLSLFSVKGKKRVPKFQSRTTDRDEETRTKLNLDSKGKVFIQLGNKSHDDYKINKDEKSVTFNFRNPPLKPLYVYKALVKIALSFLPVEKLEKYDLLFDWLMGKTDEAVYFSSLFTVAMINKRWEKPNVLLYETKNNFENNHFYPELTLIVGFGNLNIQIFLPLSKSFDFEKSRGMSPTLELYPLFIHDIPTDKPSQGYKTTIKVMDLSSNESMTFDEYLSFNYEKGDFNV
ncbi:MAG: HNH endonuclease [Flavobacteriales bacterium]|jgi:hypothetical protein|nr:HNH endonuclease [Flavobacteriales bacterium]